LNGHVADDAAGPPRIRLRDRGRYAPICGSLGPTKSYPKGRPFRWNPGTGELVVTRDRKQETYRVREIDAEKFPDDPPLRGFAVSKDSTGELYHVLCGPSGCLSCDCGASSWGASAKANNRARYAGGPTYLTAGCVHADFLELALREGMLVDRAANAASEH